MSISSNFIAYDSNNIDILLTDSIIDHLEALLATRTYLYTLFHKAFGGKPNAELIEEICSSETIDALSVYAPLDESFANLRLYCKTLSYSTVQGGFLLRVSAEYAHMLDHTHANRKIACKSSYREDACYPAHTIAIRTLLEKSGLQPSSDHAQHEDHVSLLCAFAAMQAQQALDTLRLGKIGDLAALLTEQHAFIEGHLSSWLPRFAERLQARRSAFLYPQMARCLASFVRLDRDFCLHILSLLEGREGSWDPRALPSALCQLRQA